MTTDSISYRHHDLDALRGFAMLLGILLHAAMSFISLPVTVQATQDIHQGLPVYEWLLHGIHGFRMPLFFLVSGMFTALLWRRHGLQRLVRHRLVRIGIPLMIGVCTIVPAVFAVSILWSRNIWYAAAKGDQAYVASYIATDGNVNQPLSADMQPGNGGTPLHLAVANSQYVVARQLLMADADVNARAWNLVDGVPSLATPLHWAVANRNRRMMELLLQFGAEPNVVDAIGRTPLDLLVEEAQPALVAPLMAVGGKRALDLDAREESRAAENLSMVIPEQKEETDYLGNWIRRSSVVIQLVCSIHMDRRTPSRQKISSDSTC